MKRPKKKRKKIGKTFRGIFFYSKRIKSDRPNKENTKIRRKGKKKNTYRGN